MDNVETIGNIIVRLIEYNMDVYLAFIFYNKSLEECVLRILRTIQ